VKPNRIESLGPDRVLQFVPGFLSGGIESLLMGLFRCMNKERLQFDFMVDTRDSLAEFEEIRSAGGRVFQMGRYLDAPLRYQREVGRILSTYGDDYMAVHCHTVIRALPVLIAARNRGISRRILHSHTDSLKGSRQRLIAPAIAAATAPFATDYWACSDAAGRFFFGRRPFKVFRNTIHTSEFTFDMVERARVRRELDIASSAPVIGHTGRFTFQKNHNRLIRVFSLVHGQRPDARLLLVGEGPFEAEMKALADKLGVSQAVSFVGARDDVPAFLSAMDVFCLPSHFEGFCISLLEAQASGLPCLASDVIQDDVKVTPLVRTLGLNDDLDDWSASLLELIDRRPTRSDVDADVVRQAGYDTELQSERLLGMYRGS